jgi:hypothetical protein
MKTEDRAEELAQSEDLEILSRALFIALEADLSGFKWPLNSRINLTDSEMVIEDLVRIVKVSERNDG